MSKLKIAMMLVLFGILGYLVDLDAKTGCFGYILFGLWIVFATVVSGMCLISIAVNFNK